MSRKLSFRWIGPDRPTVLKALAAVLAAHPQMPTTVTTGEIACPICEDGRLQYEITPETDETVRVTRGRCATPGCARWIE